MKKLLLITLFLGFAHLISAQSIYFKFQFNSKAELSKISRIISVDNAIGDSAWAYATPAQMHEFSNLGISYKLLQKKIPTNRVIQMATTKTQMANWDRYPTHDLYLQMMTDYATNNPTICQLVNIGTSQKGRQIVALKISDNVTADEQEPDFFYSSTMHGDETTGYPLMIRLIDYLITGYNVDTEVTNLVNNHQIFINPLANPDGTYSDNNGALSISAANATVANAVRELADGQDPNRDFPDPFFGINTPYRQETQMMMDFASAHHFVMAANFHGGAEVYNYPWDGYTTAQKPNPDKDWFVQMGLNYVQNARLLNSSYMSSVTANGITNGGDWYVITGGRQDYMNYWHHCKEITIELSNTKLVGSETLPAYWDTNKQSLLNFMKEVSFGFNGTVKNTNGNPLNAKIEIANHDADNTWVVTNPAFGDYYRPIAPGTYSVTYSSLGYISQTHQVTVQGYQTTTIKNVVLVQAQTLQFTGLVKDATSNLPINGATIEFLNSTIPSQNTLADGTFSVANIFEGTYNIKVSSLGYAPTFQTISLTTTNNNANFQLLKSDAISFETNIPAIFTFSGNAQWTRDLGTSYDYNYSMRSGVITHNQNTVMQIANYNVSVNGDISFYKKTSCEEDPNNNFDYLKFEIDGVEQGRWDGITDWAKVTYPILAGIHTFTWTFLRDGAAGGGDNAVWVDFINIPGMLTDTGFSKITENNIEIFPNPFSGNIILRIKSPTLTKATVNIYNISGKLIATPFSGKLENKVSDIAWKPAQEISQGIYFARILTKQGIFTKKIIYQK